MSALSSFFLFAQARSGVGVEQAGTGPEAASASTEGEGNNNPDVVPQSAG